MEQDTERQQMHLEQAGLVLTENKTRKIKHVHGTASR